MTGARNLRRAGADGPADLASPAIAEESSAGPVLTVVLPAYNEAESIQETVRGLAAALSELGDGYEIVVVDDGSEDATLAALRTLAEEFPTVGYVASERNHGKGHAIRQGCRAAEGDFVLLLDADGDLDPGLLETFFQRAHRTDADVVIGSKRHPDSEVSYPLSRRVMSKGYAGMVKLLLGLDVSDTQVGMKLLRAEAVESVMPLLLVDGYAIDVELLAVARAQGFDIAEAPVTLEFGGDSGVDWPSVARIVRDTLGVCCRQHLFGTYETLERTAEYVRECESGTETGGGGD